MEIVKSLYVWLRLVTMCLILGSCGGSEKQANQENWVADEILEQLSELRKDVKSLKSDLVALRTQLDKPGTRRVVADIGEVRLSTDITFGDSNSKLAIVEFTDYQCPYCARHNKTVLPQIKEKLIETGKAKYVMYDFPLGFHSQAKPAAVAARCAGKQGKYWEMHDALFSNQRQLGPDLYQTTAKELKLDEGSFRNCLGDSEIGELVDSNLDYGGQIGVSGTPKFFVGKVKGNVITDVIVISGAQGFSAFSNAIERLEKL